MRVRHIPVWDLTVKDFKRIHWRHYLTRKVFILVGIGLIGIATERGFHIWCAGKLGEFAFGTIVEHFFGVPLVEGGE